MVLEIPTFAPSVPQGVANVGIGPLGLELLLLPFSSSNGEVGVFRAVVFAHRRLDEQVAIVTGGSSGFGRAIWLSHATGRQDAIARLALCANLRRLRSIVRNSGSR